MGSEWLKIAEYSCEEDAFATTQDEFVESVGDLMTKAISTAIQETSYKIANDWREMGLAKKPRELRINEIVDCMLGYYASISEEEQKSLKNLQKLKNESLKELKDLARDLREPELVLPSNSSLLGSTRTIYLKCQELREKKQKRLKEWQNLLSRRSFLCLQMAITDDKPVVEAAIPSSEDVIKLRLSVKELEEQRRSKINKFATLQKSIVAFFEQLEREPRNDFEREVIQSHPEEFVLSTRNLKMVVDLFHELEEKLDKNRKLRDILLTEIKALWERLEESPSHRKAFLSCNVGSKPSVLKIFEEEVERLVIMKSERIALLIEKIRVEIISWQKKCCIGDDKRKHFEKFLNEKCFTEELLVLHERELEMLKRYYEETKEIFIGITNYEKLCKQFFELESKANDPDRLMNRGGILLKDAQERKKLQNKCSKLEAQLMSQTRKWYEEHDGEELLFFGVDLETFINEQWKDFNCLKENKKMGRQIQKKIEVKAKSKEIKKLKKQM